MWRFPLLLLLLSLSLGAIAAEPKLLERRLNPFGSQQEQAIELSDWQQQTAKVEQQGYRHQQTLLNFSERYQQLQQQLLNPLSSDIDPNQDLSQQRSMAQIQLQQIKDSSSTLTLQLKTLRQRLEQLPQQEQQAQQQWELAQAHDRGPIDLAREDYYSALLNTIELELQAIPKEIQLIQLKQRLVNSQQADIELHLSKLNHAISQQRREQSREAISQAHKGLSSAPNLSAISEQNALYARTLALTNGRLEQITQLLTTIERQHQSLKLEYNETQERLSWPSSGAELGQTLMRQLNRLQQNKAMPLTTEVFSESSLQRYDYEYEREKLQRKLSDAGHTSAEKNLLERQYQLLEQLLQANEQLVADFSRLTLERNKLARLQQRYRESVTAHLIWLPNAEPVSASTLTQLFEGLAWLLDDQRLKELQQAHNANVTWWSLWLLIVVLIAVILDLSKNRVNQMRLNHARFVGNVTQDKFRASLKALALAFAYSLLLPAPLWLAGAILMFGEGNNFSHAAGAGVFGLALVAQFYWLVYQLCHPQGLLVAHFRRNPPLVARTVNFLGQMHLLAAPLVAIAFFCMELELTQLHDSLGRLAYIGICLLLFYSYRRLSKLSEEYHQFHGRQDTNRRVLERVLWFVLASIPVIAIVLAVQGYFYSAQQAVGQAQVLVTAGAFYLLIYLMIKRRILIERRRLQLAQARARRAEVLAQREKEKQDGSVSSDLNIDLQEENPIDLDTVSTQSLGLVRTVLFLAFVISLLVLWSKTHPALFSFLESITLYSSTAVINGIEQEVPITLKSLVTASLIGVFSFMIASNLPGLLELALLQRLELSPGTGFALTTISKYLVYLIGTFATFSALGLAWNQMQWLIAALTVGLGFGLQEIFANFISGLIILFEKPIRIGDTVTIRDLTGTVSKIQIRATTIVDWDRKEIIVPNKAFITEQLVNWSLSDPITRVQLTISVARDSDPALVEALLHQAVQEAPLALTEPEPEIYFAGFGSHTQDYEVRAYTDEMRKRWPLKHDLHVRIKSKFNDAGVVFAYPQVDLHLNHKGGGETQLIR